jgi:addiction module HigA family antidote
MTEATFAPNWVSPTGDTIADALDERGWTQAELANRLGFTRKHVNDLIQGRASVTPETASRLETVLGSTAGFWLRREAQYRAALEDQRTRHERSEHADWLAELPLKDMTAFGWLPKAKDTADRVTHCLRFFGVASVDAWRQQYETPVAAFRAAKGREMTSGAVAAWLRFGERQAEALDCRPFNIAAFRNALQDFRAMTTEASPQQFIPHLRRRAAEHGVAVVFVAAPNGCPASGATRWLAPDRALLMLSLRYKTNDHLWFTFFHEAGHILLHSKKTQFVEGIECLDEDSEREADAFASDILIPPAQARRLEAVARQGIVSASTVRALAAEIGVAAGIVVGRMQKEGWLPWTHLNALKVRYIWHKPAMGA